MKTHRNLIYTGSEGRESPFDLFLADTSGKSPIVVFAHGYKGFKDWGAWDLIGKAFAEAGFDFLKFNFSHNGGTVQVPIDFPDLHAFGLNTYSKELEDLKAISKRITEEGIRLNGENKLWNQIALIGHSRGGGIAILHASKDASVTHLATWASVADFGERFNFDMEAWKREGVTHVLNGRTKQNMPHRYGFYQDFIDHEEQLKIETAARNIRIPWLIVHGSVDEAVDQSNPERLKKWNDCAEFVKIDGAGHTFGAEHPWPEKELPQPLTRVVEKTIDFFQK